MWTRGVRLPLAAPASKAVTGVAAGALRSDVLSAARPRGRARDRRGRGGRDAPSLHSLFCRDRGAPCLEGWDSRRSLRDGGGLLAATWTERRESRIDDPRRDFRPTPWEPFSASIDVAPKHVVFDALCTDMPALPSRVPRSSELAFCHVRALSLRYGGDRRRWSWRVASSSRTAGRRRRDGTLDAGHLGHLPIAPAPPTGPYRRHLASVVESLRDVEDAFAARSRRARRSR